MLQKKKSKKLGRPKLPDGAAKQQMLRARVSDVDMRRFETAAERAGATLPEWVRKTLLAAS